MYFFFTPPLNYHPQNVNHSIHLPIHNCLFTMLQALQERCWVCESMCTMCGSCEETLCMRTFSVCQLHWRAVHSVWRRCPNFRWWILKAQLDPIISIEVREAILINKKIPPSNVIIFLGTKASHFAERWWAHGALYLVEHIHVALVGMLYSILHGHVLLHLMADQGCNWQLWTHFCGVSGQGLMALFT